MDLKNEFLCRKNMNGRLNVVRLKEKIKKEKTVIEKLIEKKNC